MADFAASNAVPTLRAIVLDCPDPLELSRFYARILDWPPDPAPREDWVSIAGDGGRVSFQKIENYQPPTWPTGERPQMMHLDLGVTDLAAAHERVVELGARPVDLSNDTFNVYADPIGHPFCLCACS
ncbi:MAG: VOC family protein [Actinomycetota bacterium]|nr:VOC family protein [Actinomycetota bacterium]